MEYTMSFKLYFILIFSLMAGGCARSDTNKVSMEIVNDELKISIAVNEAIALPGNTFYGTIKESITNKDGKKLYRVSRRKIPCYYKGNIFILKNGEIFHYTHKLSEGFNGEVISIEFYYYNNEHDLRNSEISKRIAHTANYISGSYNPRLSSAANNP